MIYKINFFILLFSLNFLFSGNSFSDFNESKIKNLIKNLNLEIENLENNLSKNIQKINNKIDNQSLKNFEIFSLKEELKRIQYQNKYIELNNLVMDLGTEVEKIKTSQEQERERFNSLLENQEKRHKTELEFQQDRHKSFLLYTSIILTAITFFVGVFGIKYFKNKINKEIKIKIKQEFKEIEDKISNYKKTLNAQLDNQKLENDDRNPNIEGSLK